MGPADPRSKQILERAVRLSPGGPILYLATVFRRRARCDGHVFPVRGVTVVFINAGSPGRISHVRPVVLIETRSTLQLFLVNVQDGAIFLQIEVERVPRNGKILVTHPKKASVGENRVSD